MSFETGNFIPSNTIDTLHDIEIVDKPEHECGLALYYSTELSPKAQYAYAMGLAVQHRGQNAAGMAIGRTDGVERQRGFGLLADAISAKDLARLDTPSWWAMTHVRYSTNGGNDYENIQPCRAISPENVEIHVAVNGNIPAVDALKQRLAHLEDLDADISDTNVAARVLANMPGKNWDEKVKAFADLPEIQGSANNMFIAVGRTVYVMRDQFGLHPLVIGKHGGNTVITSETAGLDKIGAEFVGDFPPGGIMRLDEKGHTMVRMKDESKKLGKCIFEYAYFSSPLSMVEGTDMTVYEYRKRCGELLAKRLIEHGDPLRDVDFFVGMPDSGMPFAQGIAAAYKKPLEQQIVRSHYEEGSNTRTFMQDAQRERMPGLVRSKLMLIPDKKLWKDKRIVVADDSLVRGTNATDITQRMLKLGAKEVHWVFGFPPVRWPCHLGVSFRDVSELIAALHDSNPVLIAQAIKAASAHFMLPEDLVRAYYPDGHAIVLPADHKHVLMANGFCGGCTEGSPPVDRNGTIYRYSN